MLVSLTFNTQLFDCEDGLRNTLEQYFLGNMTAAEAQLALGVDADEFFSLLGTTFQMAQRSLEPVIGISIADGLPVSGAPHLPSKDAKPYSADASTYALRFLASNWPRIAGFAYREYQDFGRGCVLLDCFCCWGTYLPRNKLSLHLKTLPMTTTAALRDRTQTYDPDKEFVYAIGSLDGSLEQTTSSVFAKFTNIHPTAEIVFGSLRPAINPANCSAHWLAPDHWDKDDRCSGLAMLRCIPPHNNFFTMSQ